MRPPIQSAGRPSSAGGLGAGPAAGVALSVPVGQFVTGKNTSLRCVPVASEAHPRSPTWMPPIPPSGTRAVATYPPSALPVASPIVGLPPAALRSRM